jgi:hypothetical protein
LSGGAIETEEKTDPAVNHGDGDKMHGTLKASIAKPAKHSLCSVRKKTIPTTRRTIVSTESLRVERSLPNMNGDFENVLKPTKKSY